MIDDRILLENYIRTTYNLSHQFIVGKMLKSKLKAICDYYQGIIIMETLKKMYKIFTNDEDDPIEEKESIFFKEWQKCNVARDQKISYGRRILDGM